MRHARVPRAHVDELRFAGAEFFHDRADIAIRHLDHQEFNRLALFPVNLLINDDRARYLEFIALTAHFLDQDGKMQFAAAGDLKCIRGIRFLHAQGNVRFDLLHQAVAQVAGRHIFALTAGKRARVDHEHHADRRLVDLDKRQRLNMLGVAGRFADVEVRHAGYGDQIAELCALHIDAL